MNIIRQITTVEFSSFDHENLCTVLTLLENLKESLQEHGEDFIQSTVDGKCVDLSELNDVIYYLKVFANTKKFIIK